MSDELIVKGDGSAILPLIGMSYRPTFQDSTGRNIAILEESQVPHRAWHSANLAGVT